MQTSEQIDQLAAALAVAQGAFRPLKRSGFNNNFGKHYSTLTDVIEAVRPSLAANGLSFVQIPEACEDASKLALTTRLLHSSGQWMEAAQVVEVSRPASGGRSVVDFQAWMSTLTSLKRVALAALLGVSPDEDDDGNAAAAAAKAKPQSRSSAAPPASEVFPGARTGNGNGEKKLILNETDAPCPHKICNAPAGKYHGTKCPVVTGEEVLA